jgi:hypothetical protein
MAQRAQAQKKDLMMWESLREATDEEMERDPAVCVMGACDRLRSISSRSLAD